MFACMKYGFLGAGKMATAIIEGLLKREVPAARIVVAGPEKLHLEKLSHRFGVATSASNETAARSADLVLLCVKPNETAAALESCGSSLNGKILLSIVSGKTLHSLSVLAPGARIARCMPNTAATIGESATAYCCSESLTSGDRAAVESVLRCMGAFWEVPEHSLDAVTGLSGSGPAYVFLFLEALTEGGVKAGLPATLARDLAIQTLRGAAALADSEGLHPAVLREMVTSPGGTTAAGLLELENAAVRGALIRAVEAAALRATELSSAR